LVLALLATVVLAVQLERSGTYEFDVAIIVYW
jgi:hypothetical protein